MKNIFIISQLIIAIMLVILILLQSQSSGMGRSFAESGTYHSRKGAEKFIYLATVSFAILFLLASLINAFLL